MKILEKAHLPSLCQTCLSQRNQKKKVVIDCEGRKRLVHIYGVGEIKFGETKF